HEPRVITRAVTALPPRRPAATTAAIAARVRRGDAAAGEDAGAGLRGDGDDPSGARTAGESAGGEGTGDESAGVDRACGARACAGAARYPRARGGARRRRCRPRTGARR